MIWKTISIQSWERYSTYILGGTQLIQQQWVPFWTSGTYILSTYILRQTCSLWQRSRFRRALMPSWISWSSNHWEISPSAGVIHRLWRSDWSLHSSASLVGRGVGSGMLHWGLYNHSSYMQYWSNLCIADISAGCHLAMALCVCWWSFVPGGVMTIAPSCQWLTLNIPSALSLPPTVWSNLSYLKKLPIALLCMLILRLHAISRILMKSKLTLWSLGNCSSMFRNE